MTDNKVIIFGANGLLGSSLCPLLESRGWSVIRQSRGGGMDLKCDPFCIDSVRFALKGMGPISIVNLVALSNVDLCEVNTIDAYIANTQSANVLASVALELGGSRYIQISTDHIYSGEGPHAEERARPLNVYALSKLAGEFAAMNAGALILRTNFFGKSKLNKRVSYTDWLHDSFSAGKEFTVFDDVFFSALHIDTLSKFIDLSLRSEVKGVYNLGSSNGISKAKFAKLFAKSLGLSDAAMISGFLVDAGLPAVRPNDMRMNVSKFEKIFNIQLPTIEEELKKAVREYGEKHDTIF